MKIKYKSEIIECTSILHEPDTCTVIFLTAVKVHNHAQRLIVRTFTVDEANALFECMWENGKCNITDDYNVTIK